MNEIFDEVKRVTYEPPKTNADRVRSMTDEELAELLLDGLDATVCSSGCCVCDGDCRGRMLNWLKQPYVK